MFAGQGRPGDNLYATSIVALNPDTGKMAWYYQVSPHDTHDWDKIRTPVLIDARIDGKAQAPGPGGAQRLLHGPRPRYHRQAAGLHPLTVPLDWSLGHDRRGQPLPQPQEEDPNVGGSMNIDSATNWMPVTYDEGHRPLLCELGRGALDLYLTDTSPKPAGYGGTGAGVGPVERVLKGIGHQDREIRWAHRYPNANNAPTTVGPGLLSTAGGLLITGDDQKNLIIYTPSDGRILSGTPRSPPPSPTGRSPTCWTAASGSSSARATLCTPTAWARRAQLSSQSWSAAASRTKKRPSQDWEGLFPFVRPERGKMDGTDSRTRHQLEGGWAPWAGPGVDDWAGKDLAR